MTYKLYKTDANLIEANAVLKINKSNSMTSFLFAPDNTDYQTFKKEVLAGAELQDADGNTMTTEEANAFIGTLS